MTDPQQDLPPPVLAPCPFCSAQPYLADPTNFPNDWEHPWDHKGCFLDGFHITDHTAWNRRPSPKAEMQGGEMAEAMEAARRIVAADNKQRREGASLPNSPGMQIGGQAFIEMKDHVACINAALAINAVFRIDAPIIARALLSAPKDASRDDVLEEKQP